MKPLHPLGAVLLLLVGLTPTAESQSAPRTDRSHTTLALPAADSTRIRRLVKLGTVWGEIRYRHPYLATRRIEWDSVLVAALPRAEAAVDSASYASVVRSMLRAIGDPVTDLYHPYPSDSLPRSKRPFLTTDQGTLIVTPGSAPPDGPSSADLKALTERIARARSAVLDLRARPGGGLWAFTSPSAIPKLLAPWFQGELLVPGGRGSVYSGYPSQGGLTGYTLSVQSEAGAVLAGTPGPKPERLAVLLDEWTPLPPVLFVLRQRGGVFLVGEGFPNEMWAVPTRTLDAGEGVMVETRVEEFPVDERVDAIVPSRAGHEKADLAFERAKALLGASKTRPRPLPAPARPGPILRADPTYAEQPYPDRPTRQLAAIRLWNVIRLFYPYLHLLEGAWDGALERFLPRFESASNAREYAAAILEMAALVKDSHTRVHGPPVDSLLGGPAYPPIDVLEIEGKPVVVQVMDSTATPGVRSGDVLERVNGVPIEERIRAVQRYTTAANPSGMAIRLIQQALAGSDSVATWTVSGKQGRREVTVPQSRSAWERAKATASASTPPYRLLAGNVGYVSMRHLKPNQVKAMFDSLGNTRAIVFDLRCYPNGTAWPIAPYINTRRATIGALFRRPLVTSDRSYSEWYQFEQLLPVADVPLYKGRTITLIDERAISQSEHTCLFFEAANGTTFVGSPTVGSNGDVTRLTLPGGITVMFTGHDVRHADGRQLQRVGIQPDVLVRPTIAGLRAGRDEVLERALQLIERGSAAGPEPRR